MSAGRLVHRRRAELREAVPGETAVEEGDAFERRALELATEEGLVRSSALEGGVRTVAVVEDEEVPAEPIDWRRSEPGGPERIGSGGAA